MADKIRAMNYKCCQHLKIERLRQLNTCHECTHVEGQANCKTEHTTRRQKQHKCEQRPYAGGRNWTQLLDGHVVVCSVFLAGRVFAFELRSGLPLGRPQCERLQCQSVQVSAKFAPSQNDNIWRLRQLPYCDTRQVLQLKTCS